ncbi:MAG: C39 family peptidase [Candidatus Dormibacter sp.]
MKTNQRSWLLTGALLLTLLLPALLATPARPAAAAVSSGAPDRLDTFIRGTDNQLWHKWWDGRTWSPWEPLGGQLTADPAAVSSAGGRIDVFVRGVDRALWQKTFNGAAWGAWQPLGGALYSAPAVASWGPGRLDVFTVAANGNLMHNWSADGGATWNDWGNLGGQVTSDPAAVAWGAGRLDVFVRGSDEQLWHLWFDGGQWLGWQPLGGFLTSAAAVSSWGANRLDVFVRGGDNGLWHKWWDGRGWSGFEPQGGQIESNPFAISWGVGRIDVFARSSDAAMWHKWWDGRGWSAWESQGGQMIAGTDSIMFPVPVYRQSMNLDCETAALAMALAYSGHNYSQQELFNLETPDTRAPVVGGGRIQRWGDPYTNFVGNVNGTDAYPPTGYGIYYPLILSIAHSHGAPQATGGEGLFAPDIYQAVSAGRPVEVWVEVGWYRPAVHTWTAWDGRSIRYTLDEHTVVLTGVSPTSVRVNDPWHGGQYWVDKATFESSWADFHNMAIVF